MKKIYFTAIIIGLLIVSRLSFANTTNDISVDFDIIQNIKTYEVVVRIKNDSGKEVVIEHPNHQCALSFIIMDSYGNLIKPEGIAKVSPRYQPITLKPGQVFEYSIPKQLLDLAKEKELSFPFLTGTGLFGYALEKGKIYRITVVYRPFGKEQEGICSREKIIELK